MMHNGFFVHPDIWMLWFSFFVSLLIACFAFGAFIGRVAVFLFRRKK